MKLKKVLSLIIGAVILLSAFNMTGAAEEAISETINIVVGDSYTLPTTVTASDGTTQLNVTWANNASVVDTTKEGYQVFTGTAADTAGTTTANVTYRVNVGTISDVAFSDAMNYETGFNTSAKYDSGAGNTGVRVQVDKYVDGSDEVSVAEEAGNKVLSFEKATNDAGLWFFRNSDDFATDTFKISFKYKLNSLVVSETTNQYNKALDVLIIDGKNSARQVMTIRMNIGASNNVNTMELRLSDAENVSIKDYVNVTATTDTSGQRVISSDWIDFDICGNDKTYDVYVNGTCVKTKRAWVSGISLFSSQNGLKGMRMGNPGMVNSTISYIDDLKITKLCYVTDDLAGKSALDVVGLGQNTAETIGLPLAMSNGTNKSFTVNYTADTATFGTKNTTGSLEGFSQTVPVSYKVCNYNVTDLTYTDVAEGKSVSAKFAKKGASVSGGKAIFAWFADDVLTTTRIVDLANVTDAQTEVPIGTVPASAADDVVKVFIWDSMNTLKPIDLSEVITAE